MNREVPVVLISSDEYVPAAAVTLQSLLDHYAGKDPLKVYILTSDMTEEHAEKFRSYSSETASVEVMNVDISMFKQFEIEGYYVSVIDFLKMRLAELLPQYDKIINLDIDIIVRKDISPLMKVDLDGYYIAGVADMVAMETLQWHKRLHRMRYVNCGILILNAKRLRKEKCFEKCMKIKMAHSEYQCYEQDVQNDLYNDEIKYLPPMWNLMTFNLVLNPITQYSINQINTFYGSKYNTFQEMEDDAAIIHLTGEFKPWTHANTYMSEEWMAIYKQTKFETREFHLKKKPKEICEKNVQEVRMEGGSTPEDRAVHIVKRIGLLVKDWTEKYTVLRFFGIPLVEKIKDGWRTRFKVFGIPLFKREWTDFEEKTYLFDICVRAKPHWPAIKQRADELFGRLEPGGTQFALAAPNVAPYAGVLAQIELLEMMGHDRRP